MCDSVCKRQALSSFSQVQLITSWTKCSGQWALGQECNRELSHILCNNARMAESHC